MVEQPPPSPDRRAGFDQDGDATRRTWLANERTMLAWLRTGLTATAVAFGIGKLIPDIANHATRWPYVVIGVGYGVLGVALIVYGLRRHREVDDAIRVGRYTPAGDRMLACIGIAAVVLAIAGTVVLALDA